MATFGENLMEYLTRVEAGYGLGPQLPPVFDLIKGTGLSAGGSQLVYTDFFTQTYGRKVWDILNNQVKTFNLFRKVPFGTTVGWRNRSARNTSTAPVAENAALPAVAKSTYQQIWSPPRAIVTMLGVTEQAQYLAGIEGGIGDALAVEQEFASIDHIKDINGGILDNNYVVCTTAGLTSGAAIIAPATALRPGDIIYGTATDKNGANSGSYLAICVAPNRSTGAHTFLSVGTQNGSGPTDPITLVQDNEYMVVGRGGITALDDVVEYDGRVLSLASNPAEGVKCYNWGVIPGATTLTASGVNRTAAAYNAGNVVGNAGVTRYLETELIDQAIRYVREAGGEPDIILSGFDQLDRVDQLLQAQRRYMPEASFQVKRGGEATLPGFQAGFQLATYRGIPFFPDVDMKKGYDYSAGAHTLTAGGCDVFVLDTRWLELAVASMTRYFESRDYLQNDMLGIKGMFFTYAELRCLDVRKQAKISDLKTV
jgi:hypothetical protein